MGVNMMGAEFFQALEAVDNTFYRRWNFRVPSLR